MESWRAAYLNFNILKLGCLFIIFYLSFLSADWHDRKCEGWAYFEEFLVSEKKKKENVKLKDECCPSKMLAMRKQEMENAFAQAVLEPTEENILHYLELQHQWLIRSGMVANVWSKVVLDHPELNNTLTGLPISSYGTKYYHRIKSEEQKELIQELSAIIDPEK